MTFLATPPFQSSQPEDDPEVESESPFIEERPPSSPPSQPAKGPVPLVEIVWTPRGHMTIKIPIDIVDKISRLFSQQGGGASTPVPATAAVRKHLKEYLETNPTANLDFSFLALQNPTSITSRTTEENHGSSCKKKCGCRHRRLVSFSYWVSEVV
ncbi:hypothetical protein G7Y89_g646 [Cudoniella acicularis]|uniref:Uncharacterized protein n=1 Tax=Cudoniella acicularis TaxID=354080 RepID=A0A8H4W7Q5_9HELO|nr:hypothetical protein G7Y89_g646 [Cudoniella acicularis]